MNRDISTEESYYFLRQISSGTGHTQRSLSKDLGYSLGKINYLVKALSEKGLIKLVNFSRNSKKLGYCYVLTPRGLSEKTRITKAFLDRKQNEYDKLWREIEQARLEMQYQNQTAGFVSNINDTIFE